MTAPVTLAELLAASRVFALREAIVATLRAQFVDCEVKAHLGRLDMSDVDGEAVPFAVPSLNVGVVRVQPAEGRLSGHRDVPVEIAVYVVAADAVVGGKGALRDEIGLALCDGVLAVLEDPAASRWGLADIDPMEAAEARPLFTARSAKSGLVFFAVTWRQTLYALGQPFMDLDSPIGAAPTVLLPGDVGWTPPGVGP